VRVGEASPLAGVRREGVVGQGCHRPSSGTGGRHGEDPLSLEFVRQKLDRAAIEMALIDLAGKPSGCPASPLDSS
jgi:L-alanine-DL-glutamate epimerase-like enolase superfamily enzyme